MLPVRVPEPDASPCAYALPRTPDPGPGRSGHAVTRRTHSSSCFGLISLCASVSHVRMRRSTRRSSQYSHVLPRSAFATSQLPSARGAQQPLIRPLHSLLARGHITHIYATDWHSTPWVRKAGLTPSRRHHRRCHRKRSSFRRRVHQAQLGVRAAAVCNRAGASGRGQSRTASRRAPLWRLPTEVAQVAHRTSSCAAAMPSWPPRRRRPCRPAPRPPRLTTPPQRRLATEPKDSSASRAACPLVRLSLQQQRPQALRRHRA